MKEADLEYLFKALGKESENNELSFSELEELSLVCYQHSMKRNWDDLREVANKSIIALRSNPMLAEETRSKFLLARFLHFRGEALSEKGLDGEAFKDFRASAEIFKSARQDYAYLDNFLDPSLYLQSLISIGDVYLNGREFQKAQQIFDECLLKAKEFYDLAKKQKISKSQNNILRMILSLCLDRLTAIALKNGEVEKAIALSQRIIKLFSKDMDDDYSKYACSTAHAQLATIYLAEGKPQKAKKEIIASLKIREKTNISQIDGATEYGAYRSIYQILSDIEDYLGHYDNSAKAHKRAVEYQQELCRLHPTPNNERELLDDNIQLVKLYYKAQKYTKTAKLAKKTAEECEGYYGNPQFNKETAMEGYLTSLKYLGNSCLKLKHFEKAVEILGKWLSAAEQNRNMDLKAMDHISLFEVLMSKSLALKALNRYVEAFASVKEALALLEPIPISEMDDYELKLLKSGRNLYKRLKSQL